MALESVSSGKDCMGYTVIGGYILGVAITAIPFVIGLIHKWDMGIVAGACNPVLGGIYGMIGAAFLFKIIESLKERNFKLPIFHIPKPNHFESEL